MVEKRRRYTREFKLEAVKLALESDRPLAEVARDLGYPIPRNLISNYLKVKHVIPKEHGD